MHPIPRVHLSFYNNLPTMCAFDTILAGLDGTVGRKLAKQAWLLTVWPSDHPLQAANSMSIRSPTGELVLSLYMS